MRRIRCLLKTLFILMVTAAVFFIPKNSFAVRPFITDDARIASTEEIQIETSLRVDQERVQNLNVISFGLTKKLEGSFNFIDGYMREDETRNQLSVAGPGFQFKYLFTDGKAAGFPATGLVAGVTPPYGAGSSTFANPAWGDYLYAVATKFFFRDQETLNLHINVGFNNSYAGRPTTSFSWGVGVQAHVIDKLYLCTEIYQGDPYAITPGALYQVGLRYFISDKMQADIATGKGIYGDPMLGQYVSAGFRIVLDNIRKK
jgi:hypothetical protein